MTNVARPKPLWPSILARADALRRLRHSRVQWIELAELALQCESLDKWSAAVRHLRAADELTDAESAYLLESFVEGARETAGDHERRQQRLTALLRACRANDVVGLAEPPSDAFDELCAGGRRTFRGAHQLEVSFSDPRENPHSVLADDDSESRMTKAAFERTVSFADQGMEDVLDVVDGEEPVASLDCWFYAIKGARITTVIAAAASAALFDVLLEFAPDSPLKTDALADELGTQAMRAMLSTTTKASQNPDYQARRRRHEARERELKIAYYRMRGEYALAHLLIVAPDQYERLVRKGGRELTRSVG